METFIRNLQSPLLGVLNYFALRFVNTGDRVFDTALHTLCMTFFGSAIGFLITLACGGYSFQNLLSKVRRVFKRNSTPWIFQLADIPEPVLKKTPYFLCQANPKTAFIEWMMEHHWEKLSDATDQFTFSFDCKSKLQQAAKWPQAAIWFDGKEVVYSKRSPGSPVCEFSSTSPFALRACIQHLNPILEDTEVAAEKKFVATLTSTGSDEKMTTFLSTRKVFDCLYFDDKKAILTMLEKFKQGKLYSERISVENKLGFLLHGEPGTGKTGFITALANYLKRNVIILDMTKIKTRQQFRQAVSTAPFDSTIIVFEEMDCMTGVLTRANNANNNGTDASMTLDKRKNNLYMKMLEKDEKTREEFFKELQDLKDKLDIGFLLQWFDGLERAEGRVIVATTNYPERIDPALLRPGRLGTKVFMQKCSHQMLADIIGAKFERHVPLKKVKHIPERKWSPCEVLENSILYNDVDSLLQFLATGTPWGSTQQTA